MEEKKTDFNSLIGMILIGIIMLWYFNTNKPQDAETTEQTMTEQVSTTTPTNNNTTTQPIAVNDSITKIQQAQKFGAFQQGTSEANKTIENNLVRFAISPKGGQIVQAELKKYKTYDSLPLYMINDGNSVFDLQLYLNDNRVINTKDLVFTPSVTNNGKTLTMKAVVSPTQFLEYRYDLKDDDYMVDFTVRSQGLSNVLNTSKPIELNWDLKGLRHEKSMYAENSMYTWYYYKQESDLEYLSPDDDEVAEDVKWVAYKQHFFSSILRNKDGFKSAQLTSKNLVQNEEIDTVYTKDFGLKTNLAFKGGELNESMQWYYGPNDYQVLKKYEGTDLKEVVDLGWGIFGFINKTVYIPIFNFLKGFITNYGILIILLTIAVKLILSPLLYKSYLSGAKMKVLRPEMEAINKRLPGKENAMKRQQETMALQSKAGVSPLAGCIPALLQMPILFALFKFFPSNLDLRQKGFLWAEDLSSYDVVFKLPFNIPFYGDHVSLFPILAAVAIFFYMRMSQSQQMSMQQPPQEGMPDMQKLMKYMLYFSPIMLLVFFNNYASGLSLYYFTSNLLTLGIMYAIKNYFIDEDKIHAQIQENKKKPKKQSKFRERLDKAMKEAQAQQEAQKRAKNKK